MLNLYRRHTKSCTKGFPESDSRQNCTCVVWVMGQLGDEFVRKSTKTRSLIEARRMVVDAEERGAWESAESAATAGTSTLLDAAIEAYLAECSDTNGKGVAPATISKYKTTLFRLRDFCVTRGVYTVADIDFPLLHAFKATWKTGAQTAANNVARLRSFWKFAVKMEWCHDNPAQKLEFPRNVVNKEKLPFTDREVERILKAVRTIKFDVQQTVNNHEVETFILLMLHGGIGISDAALFQRSELVGDEIRLFRKKTRRSARRRQVIVPLPHELVSRLKAMPVYHGTYLFCKGSDNLVSVTDVWQSRIRQVLRHAGIVDGTSHRFRHTFANTWLKRDIGIETVSQLLGHSSVKTAEKAYSHYLEDRVQTRSNRLREHYKSS